MFLKASLYVIFIFTLLTCLSGYATTTSAGTSQTQQLAVGQTPKAMQYEHNICSKELPSPVAKALLPVLTDLSSYLNQITGQAFSQCTNPANGIVLLLSDSRDAPSSETRLLQGKPPGTFYIKGSPTRLLIVANEQSGLSNGIYFYLESLGVRWLLPGENWTIVPHLSNITLTTNQLVEPEFRLREFFGTGGFLSTHWGGRYAGTELMQNLWRQWHRRQRYTNDYWGIALQNVGLGYGYNKKPNVTDPAVVNSYCAAVINRHVALHGAPSAGSTVSVEPSDGGGWAPSTTSGLPGNGSPSDQDWYLVNQCAKMLADKYPGVYAVAMAYFDHASPPSFPIESNVLVMEAPYAFQPVPADRLLAEWKNKATLHTLYDYWSIPDWKGDRPSFDFLTLKAKLKNWRANGILGVDAESTYSGGAMGLGHYEAAHLMWNLGINDAALRDDWYTQAFGPAKAPMQKMMERWANTGFRLISEEIRQSFNDIAQAESLASGNRAVMARVDDFARYVQYLRLWLDLENETNAANKPARVTTLIQHILSINDSAMVDTIRIADLLTARYPSLVAAFTLDPTPGPGWAGVKPLSHSDILSFVAKGLRDYPAPDWTPKTYTGALTILAANRDVPVQIGEWENPVLAVGPTDVFFEVKEGMSGLLAARESSR